MLRQAIALGAAVHRGGAGASAPKPIVVAGARELVPLLARELRANGEASAVREGSPRGASVFVWIGKPDLGALRAASRAQVPIVGVTDGESLPYVLDTNLVVVRPGEGLPTERVARAIAAVAPEGWARLARRLPVLREALVDEAIRRQARLNARAAASVDRARAATALTVPQMRLASAIASAYGSDHGATRLLAGDLAYVPFIRMISRRLGRRLPARRLVRAGLAYAVTRAVGEAARWSVRPRS